MLSDLTARYAERASLTKPFAYGLKPVWYQQGSAAILVELWIGMICSLLARPAGHFRLALPSPLSPEPRRYGGRWPMPERLTVPAGDVDMTVLPDCGISARQLYVGVIGIGHIRSTDHESRTNRCKSAVSGPQRSRPEVLGHLPRHGIETVWRK